MMYGVLAYLHPPNGKVLMIKKPEKELDPNSGLYTLPGGKLEDSEKGLHSIKGRLEAAVRETKQETGLTMLEPIIKGSILFDNSERTFDNWPNAPDYLVYIVFSQSCIGRLKEKGDNGEIPFWVDQYDIPRLPKNAGDALIYDWIRWHKESFFGVIKHKGRVLDEKGTWVDYLD